MKQKTKPIYRCTYFVEVKSQDATVIWQIRETLSSRWYCFDEFGKCFAWSCVGGSALLKLSEWARFLGYEVGKKTIVKTALTS